MVKKSSKKSSKKKVSIKVPRRAKTILKKSRKTKKAKSSKTYAKSGSISNTQRMASALKYGSQGGSIGRKYGALLGGAPGAALGSMLGSIAGGGYGIVTGHGDYNIRSNSLTNPGEQIPSFDANGNHCVRVKHREYVGDITGTTDPFAVTAYEFNPGNKVLFPWLSSIANNFDEYSWSGALVELKSISGVSVGSTNEALGFMAMGAEYNASLPAYTSKLQLENAEFSVSGPPSANIILPIECKRSQTVIGQLYVNNGDTPTGQDARLYDHCLLNVAVGNQQAAYKVAELWISYDVCLYKPKFGYSTNSVYMTHIISTTATTTNYFGTTQTVRLNSTFSPTLTGTTITLPSNTPLGTYCIYYQVTGTGGVTGVGPIMAFSGGCTGLNILKNDTASQVQMPSALGTGSVIATAFFTVTAESGVITFSGATLPTSVTSMDLVISMMNARITT